MIIRVAGIVFLNVLMLGCASSHYVVDGACYTCLNNPLTGEAINYDKDKYSFEKNSTKQPIIELNTFHATPLDTSNYYYHWAAANTSYESERKIILLANKYVKEYRDANEFVKPRILDAIRSQLTDRIEQARAVTKNKITYYVNLRTYNFVNEIFHVDFNGTTPLGVADRRYVNRSQEIEYLGAPNSNILDIHVTQDEAEKAIAAGPDGKRLAKQKVHLEIVSASDACDSVCTIVVRPSSVELLNYATEKVIGNYKFR